MGACNCRHETIPSACPNVRESEQTYLEHSFSVSVSTSQWGTSRIPGATRLATGQSLRESRCWCAAAILRCQWLHRCMQAYLAAPSMALSEHLSLFQGHLK